MSLISEQLNAIKYVGKFMDDLRFGPRMKKAELVERLQQLTRHYPGDLELEMWRGWLLRGKGHE